MAAGVTTDRFADSEPANRLPVCSNQIDGQRNGSFVGGDVAVDDTERRARIDGWLQRNEGASTPAPACWAKAMRGLVTSAQRAGWRLQVEHGHDSAGDPFLTVKAVGVGDVAIRATWHTRDNLGRYRLFSAMLFRPYHGWSHTTVTELRTVVLEQSPLPPKVVGRVLDELDAVARNPVQGMAMHKVIAQRIVDEFAGREEEQ